MTAMGLPFRQPHYCLKRRDGDDARRAACDFIGVFMKKVKLYTDGACRGNPGPGGWGAVLRYNGREKELSGGEKDTTNNRMELTAAM